MHWQEELQWQRVHIPRRELGIFNRLPQAVEADTARKARVHHRPAALVGLVEPEASHELSLLQQLKWGWLVGKQPSI